MKTQRLIGTCFLLVSMALVSAAGSLTARASTTVYQASTAFGNGLGIQGKDQWYYQQLSGSTYSNLTWDNANQKWYGTQTYLAITGTIMHPEASLDAVRKWVAPCDGSARIYGNVKKNDTGGGDGVKVTIKQNSTVKWGTNTIAYNDSTGLNYDFTTQVKAGDAIYFIVNRNSNIYFDSTCWDPAVDFTPCAAGTSVSEWNYTSGTDSWKANYHCAVSASGGYLNATISGADPSVISADNLGIDLTKTSTIKIRYKNSTDNTCAQVYFTTNEDTAFTQAKCLVFAVNANDSNYTEYTLDMSGVYGWAGKLKQIRFDPTEASSGTCSIDSIRLLAGGAKTPPFSLLDKEVVYNDNTLKNVLNLDYYADSSFGVRRNSDASYDFYTSDAGASTGQYSTITHGTLENPAASITYKWKAVSGIPSNIDYTTVGPVYQDPNDANTLLSFLHLERRFTIDSAFYYDASLGLAITRDNGATWTFCGEIIDHDIAPDESRPYSYDIGGGTHLICNVDGVDYFYVYAIDSSETNPYKPGLSVSRAPVSSVLAAAKNNTTVPWYKYCNGDWTQPGLYGSFTDLFPGSRSMNWMSVSYNSYINKYLLAYVTTDQWSANYSDISLIIASSPTDFVSNASEYLIDSSTKYTQYPTIVGLGNNDPEKTSQKNFYIYYMQWANDQIFASDTNLIRKMVVLD